MARLVLVQDECRAKVSPQCEGNFTFERKRGRPPVNCKPCRDFKQPKTTRPAKVKVEKSEAEQVEATAKRCPCGQPVEKKDPKKKGRGFSKCAVCREENKTYRTDDDGNTREISKAEISEEERIRKEAEGRIRAENLINMMQSLPSYQEWKRKEAAGSF